MPTFSLFVPTPPLFRNSQNHKLPRCLIFANGRPPRPGPPQTKPAFYKNPSKAIEKGGGFFIPGLRGPRLRIAVSALAATLLSLNHFSAGAAIAQSNLRVSEALATTATIAVLVTALVDIAAEQRERSPTSVQSATIFSQQSDDRTVASGGSVETEEVAWVEAVTADLAGVNATAVCREGYVVYASGSATDGAEAGEVARRVAKEGRAFYVDDSSSLPSEATFPFLEQEVWAVFMVPVSGDVVAFARRRTEGQFEIADRSWLTQIAQRLARACR